MKHLKLVTGLLALGLQAQNGTKIAGDRTITGLWDASGSPKTKFVKVVSTDPVGSCVSSDNAWEWNPTTRRLFACAAGTWYKMADAAGLGGGVSSFATRTGAVIADGTDYASFYPTFSGSYANPSWISSLAAAKLSGSGTLPLALLAQTAATVGEVLGWNGSGWVPSAPIAIGQGLAFCGSLLCVTQPPCPRLIRSREGTRPPA